MTCGVYLVEQPIYGLGREGSVMAGGGLEITLPVHDTLYSRTLGEKYYELSDQLGSARMVISDRKLSEIVGGVPGKYRAEVKTFTNLYPFGMEEPGRYMAGDAYRYGYQGMEKDSTSGGERYTTTYRLYDARLGRWLSVDPVTDASVGPYVAMNNDPVAVVDPSGAVGDEPSSTGGDATPLEPGRAPGRKKMDATAVSLENANLPVLNGPPIEGSYSSNGAVGGREGYWHNDPDGSSYYQQADVYKTMVDGFVEKMIMWEQDFTPEAAGFRSGDMKSYAFQQLYQMATWKYETAGMMVQGHRNPFFTGDQIYDNSGDILMAIDFGIGIWKLGAGATKYIVSRSASRGIVGGGEAITEAVGIGAVGGEIQLSIGSARND